MRIRAGGIIIKDNKILLIYRNKKGRGEYYIFPGGGVEEGEDIKQASIREMKEETNLDVVLGELYYTHTDPTYDAFEGGMQEHYFLISEYSGDFTIGGPEAERQNPDNIYKLVWVDMKDLLKIDLAPVPLVEKIIQDYAK